MKNAMATNMRTDVKSELAFQTLQLRYWQHLVNEALKKNIFAVPVHMAIGHEALAAAVSSAIQSGDQLLLTHRNIVHNLARAGSLRPLWEEYKHVPSGLGKGLLGSMNVTNPTRGVVYSSSILGNNMPVACGVALGNQIKSNSNVVIVVTGDGAMEEGTFYESLVLARSQNLRLVFLIENNNFSMSSTIAERRCPIDVEHMCKAVNVPYLNLKGNLVFDYATQIAQFRENVVRQSCPAVIEAFVTNFYRHAGPTPGWPTDPMNIDLKNGLIVKTTDQDPIFVLRENMDPKTYSDLEAQVMSEQWALN